MSKVWINPAFKDKLIDKKEDPPPPVKKEKKESKVKVSTKEEKQKTSEEKPQSEDKSPEKEKPEKKKKEKKPAEKPTPQPKGDSFNELKLLQMLQDKNIPIEGMLINGMKINGKIKWFTQSTVGLLLDDGRDIILNRLILIYYSQPKEYSLSRKDFDEIPKPTTINNETTELRRLKDEKAILLFHLKNGIDITGKIDWSDYLIYHVISPDDEKEYSIPKSSVLYIEEVKA